MDAGYKFYVNHVANQIIELADKYFTHPDPVARIYGMTRAVESEIMERMGKINQSERHSYDG